MDTGRFRNRAAAGRALAEALSTRQFLDPVVLALPRGGVPVAAEVAVALGAALDLIFVRKIGAPHQKEWAAAAIVDDGAPQIVVNDASIVSGGATQAQIDAQAPFELGEIERQRAIYLADRPRVPLDGRVLIVVDDGIATGTTVRAALVALRRRSPSRLVLAVPVAPVDVVEELRPSVDDLICLKAPKLLESVGAHYDDFSQVSDREVVRRLAAVDAAYRSRQAAKRPDERRARS